MKRLNDSQKQKLVKFSKHPLLITLVGTLIASALIPWIVGRSNHQAAVARPRVDQAVEMMNAANSVNVLLNQMKCEFENFENDSLSCSTEELAKRRDELRGEIYALHRKLNGIAWWWPWNISYRARALQLISDKDSQNLKETTVKYLHNVEETLNILKTAWKKYIDCAASKEAKAERMLFEKDQELQTLQTERDDLARQMAAVLQ